MGGIWWDESDRRDRRARLAAGDPTLVGLCRRARREPDTDAIESATLLALLEADAPSAATCWTLLQARLGEERVAGSDLGRASLALHAALLHDCGGALLDASARRDLARYAADLARSFRTVGRGNPHNVTNNWWAVTHAGALLAALTARAAGVAVTEMDELVAWAGGRLWPFCHHFGDRGLYHEGLGYQGYTQGFLFAALLAWRRHGGPDPLQRFPQLGWSSIALLTACTFRPHLDVERGEPAGWGSSLSWNDAGYGAHGGAALPLGLACAPPATRGALRWCYDRLHGHLVPGDAGSYSAGNGGMVFSALYYPFDTPACPPAGILPLSLTDGRQGLHLVRERWQDGDDGVFGLLARSTHVGGHSQDDAASIRWSCRGHDWLVGGGQARGRAEWQCLPVPADGERPKPAAHAALVWDQATAHGSIVAVDHRRACGCYAERSCAVRHGLPDDVTALAILDLIDDHLGRDWHWHWSHAPDLACELLPEGAGFVLRHGDGTSCAVRFLADRPAAIELQCMPESRRTYSSGGEHVYPGWPFIRCHFTARRPLGIQVVATVQRGAAPTVVRPGSGVDLRIGAEDWPRPFAAAVPIAFEPGRSGSLMQMPGGA